MQLNHSRFPTEQSSAAALRAQYISRVGQQEVDLDINYREVEEQIAALRPRLSEESLTELAPPRGATTEDGTSLEALYRDLCALAELYMEAADHWYEAEDKILVLLAELEDPRRLAEILAEYAQDHPDLYERDWDGRLEPVGLAERWIEAARDIAAKAAEADADAKQGILHLAPLFTRSTHEELRLLEGDSDGSLFDELDGYLTDAWAGLSFPHLHALMLSLHEEITGLLKLLDEYRGVSTVAQAIEEPDDLQPEQ